VEAVYRQAGFETRAQSHGADGGVDIWLHAPQAPEKPVGVVQCKHHRKPIGVDKMRELRGVMAAHGVPRGQFFSTAGFTHDAEAFASANGINLLDGSALLNLIGRRTAKQQAELLAVATEGEFWRPTCARCGVKMVERAPRDGGRAFWGCGNYPRCRSTLPMRTALTGAVIAAEEVQ
jgi:restriction system protein